MALVLEKRKEVSEMNLGQIFGLTCSILIVVFILAGAVFRKPYDAKKLMDLLEKKSNLFQ